MLLNQSMPLFIPLVERAWLGERIPTRLWGVLGLGFAGLLLILRPGTGVFEPAALVGLASAVLASVAQVGIRRLTRTEPVTRIVFSSRRAPSSPKIGTSWKGCCFAPSSARWPSW